MRRPARHCGGCSGGHPRLAGYRGASATGFRSPSVAYKAHRCFGAGTQDDDVGEAGRRPYIDLFTSVQEARLWAEQHRIEFNTYRPHLPLQGRTPLEVLQQWRAALRPTSSQRNWTSKGGHVNIDVLKSPQPLRRCRRSQCHWA